MVSSHYGTLTKLLVKMKTMPSCLARSVLSDNAICDRDSCVQIDADPDCVLYCFAFYFGINYFFYMLTGKLRILIRIQQNVIWNRIYKIITLSHFLHP